MKIKTWIKYEESYLPPRCRKLRYRKCEDYINVTLKEVDGSELQLAFEDNSFEGRGKIYSYGGKLWCKETMPHANIVESIREREYEMDTPLDYLIWQHEHCSTYFYCDYERENGKDTSKEAVIKLAKENMKKYILVNGELYKKSAEPRYVVVTFGLGHNHGGTGMFCEYHYNPNISKDSYFSALQGVQAVAYANKVASQRGDTNDVGKFEPFIVCHMPELVKVKPNKQHGNGNEFLNYCEEIIRGTDNTLEAGLMVMALTLK